ncbi:hypothetical protein [Leucothrix pacifica]|uniref:Uncharacterized protein n=1 Tax=Leucothrix pacifica TaxID=1247513 RepID=A0A317CV54_9GAMM|nr:hypothetical protein [Leucothrix pacifica]PWR00223.1 hypothetical protein DKW60_03530 [Leucothrix pacifica]
MKPTSVLGIFAWLSKGKPPLNDEPVESAGDSMAEDDAESGITSLEKTNVTVISANGSVKVYVRDVEYNLRLMKPAHGVGVPELKRSLERNREMMGQSFEKMQSIYRNFRTTTDPLVIETEGAYRTATKNALVARANIDVLIPLINIRGGDAEYEGAGEGLPIEQHVEKLRRTAELMVDFELGSDEDDEDDGEVNLQSVFIAGVIVVLVVMLLKVFL